MNDNIRVMLHEKNAPIFGWEKHANKQNCTDGGYISFSKRANDGANWEFFVFFEKIVKILAYSK